MKKLPAIAIAIAIASCLAVHPLRADAPPESGSLLDIAALSDASGIKVENGAAASLGDASGAKAVKLDFPGNGSYPGADLPPSGGMWNLTGYTGVAVTVTNAGTAKVGVGLRVDNPGDWRSNPWDSEVVWIDPGATQAVKVTFGQSYGKPGFALDPAQVKNIKVMMTNPKAPGTLLITSVQAVK